MDEASGGAGHAKGRHGRCGLGGTPPGERPNRAPPVGVHGGAPGGAPRHLEACRTAHPLTPVVLTGVMVEHGFRAGDKPSTTRDFACGVCGTTIRAGDMVAAYRNANKPTSRGWGVVKLKKTTSPPYDELLLPPLVPPCRGGPRGGCLRAPTSSSKDFLFLEGARDRPEPGPPAQPARACD